MMKISTEEFIALVKDRPPLWQKSHPDFANRDIRNKLLTEIGTEAEMNTTECAKKLKNLKDTMRAQVAKLPKSNSGMPAFELSDNFISWPFFPHMLFMQDEFVGRKMALSLQCNSNNDESLPCNNDVNIQCNNDGSLPCKSEDDEAVPVSLMSAHDDISMQSSPSSPPLSLQMTCTQADGPSNSYSEGIYEKRGKRRRETSGYLSEYEERKLAMLEKVSATDELDTFAADIANDLRKIKNPLKLMQAKAKIRRITEEYVMSDMVS